MLKILLIILSAVVISAICIYFRRAYIHRRAIRIEKCKKIIEVMNEPNPILSEMKFTETEKTNITINSKMPVVSWRKL